MFFFDHKGFKLQQDKKVEPQEKRNSAKFNDYDPNFSYKIRPTYYIVIKPTWFKPFWNSSNVNS